VSGERKRYCPKGHDKLVHGDEKSRCRQCNRDAQKNRRRNTGPELDIGNSHLNRIHVAYQPLRDLLVSREVSIEELGNNTARVLYRAQKKGRASVAVVDAMCIYLGINPAVVYGQSWWCADCPLFAQKLRVA
jgi:hypothetical protein